jgi:DNA-binding transcriptional ArsR family regulator
MKINELAKASGRAAAFLRAVAHPARLRVVCALLDGECAAGPLAASAQLRAAALSQQAAVLEREGLIRRERRAQSVYYSLAAPHVRQLARLLHDTFCATPRRPSTRRRKPASG